MNRRNFFRGLFALPFVTKGLSAEAASGGFLYSNKGAGGWRSMDGRLFVDTITDAPSQGDLASYAHLKCGLWRPLTRRSDG